MTTASKPDPNAKPSKLLRAATAERTERRYEPKPGAGAFVGMLLASVGMVAVGAGFYGQWLRATELGPHPYAVYLLGAGAAVLLAVAVLARRVPGTVAVGDAGVGFESEPGRFDRLAWCDVESVSLGASLVLTSAAGSRVAIPVAAHPDAAAQALAEARARIPKKVGSLKGKLVGDVAAGRLVQLDPPQVAGLHCKASGALISFERDARLCSRCGELYSKSGAPTRCLTCDAQLA